jgi:hypothetical protein
MTPETRHECKVIGLSIVLTSFPAALCVLFWWIT